MIGAIAITLVGGQLGDALAPVVVGIFSAWIVYGRLPRVV